MEDDDYMSDTPETAEQPVQEKTEPKNDERTALLPLSFFEGKEVTPGTVCKVRVERVHEDQAEVTYLPHSEEEGSEAEVPEEDYMA